MLVPRGPNKDLATVAMPYPTATHYRHAHLMLESASLGKPGPPHNEDSTSSDWQLVTHRSPKEVD
jgi:hypothetical protein